MGNITKLELDVILLEESIQNKWQKIREGILFDKGSANCPLCEPYLDGNCTGCPIPDYSHCPECAHTPYGEFRRHLHAHEEHYEIYKDCCIPFIDAEINFLREIKQDLERQLARLKNRSVFSYKYSKKYSSNDSFVTQ